MARLHVGLTGGIASGKSTATRAFEALGAAVVDADVAAREVVAPGSVGLAEVVRCFGAGVLNADGQLDRAAMRRRVFDDPSARAALEAIVHPRVREALQAHAAATRGEYVVVAIPLLAEGGGRGAYPWLDRVVVVDAPEDVQRARLLRRDGIDAALADSMITAQATRAGRLAMADDVLVNDADEATLVEGVAVLDRRFRAMAGVA